MPWSQVVARKRTSLMNATFENNTHHSQQDKVIHSKVWRAGRSPGNALLDMTDGSESSVQLMTLIAKQFPSRLGSYPAIDHILKDGITFENDAVRLLPCRALDPAVPLIWGSYKNPTPAPIWAEDEGFYAVWIDMPTYCRYCHAEGHAVPDCPKKRSSRVCWNCRASGHIVAECAKCKNKPFKKDRKTPTASQDRVDQDEVQSNQASSDIAMSSTSPQPFTSNIMKRKRSIRNESGDDPRIHSSTLLTTEKDSILVSTQEVLKSLFTTPAESQDDIQVETNAGSIGNSHVAADIVIVDQETKNIPQSLHQAAIDGPPLVISSMAPQCSTSMVL
ncbi:hypothetical protein G6F64_003355 [Rhizopus arrhizus]|uniref:CCHC-type domain-containing protein n=1 Tax=Rhizopus oryzae TaxID=64495 RepID=A0A9P6XEK4_RHIOR|nr:hypothetical protein G6F64_003355 [Rhizopus arrhizus]